MRGQGARGLVRQRPHRPPLPAALLRGRDRRHPGRPARLRGRRGSHLAGAAERAPRRPRTRRPRPDSWERRPGRQPVRPGSGGPDDPNDPGTGRAIRSAPDVDTSGPSSVPIPLARPRRHVARAARGRRPRLPLAPPPGRAAARRAPGPDDDRSARRRELHRWQRRSGCAICEGAGLRAHVADAPWSGYARASSSRLRRHWRGPFVLPSSRRHSGSRRRAAAAAARARARATGPTTAASTASTSSQCYEEAIDALPIGPPRLHERARTSSPARCRARSARERRARRQAAEQSRRVVAADLLPVLAAAADASRSWRRAFSASSSRRTGGASYAGPA